MGRGSSKLSGGGGGGLPGGLRLQDDPVLAGLNVDLSSSKQFLYAQRASDIKAGDTLQDLFFDAEGGPKGHVSWTFHPEGLGDTFKGFSYSDIKITEVKVTGKQVKVTGLYDKAVGKAHPTADDFGKDFIKVTKTFKPNEIVRKRVKWS